MSATDGQIIAASLTEPVRFAGIFDRHVDSIRRYVTRRIGASGGDDVISEVFRVAFERRRAFELEAPSALPWLYGIAANLVRRDHRSRTRRIAALERLDGRRDVVGDPMLDVVARIDARADVDKLQSALLALSDDERDVLLLVAWEELSPSEAAIALGIPSETARTRLHRARQRVRIHLIRDQHTLEASADAN